MVKIQDRVLLGALCGLGGGLVKNALSELSIRAGLAEYGGPSRAAGMLVSAHKITTPRGKLVGWIADSSISAMLGVAAVYMLSITGKEKAPLKGALVCGASAWTALYGVLGTMGATEVQHPLPRTVLSEFFVHTVYGAVVASLAAYLGDEALFEGGFLRRPKGLSSQPDETRPGSGVRTAKYQIRRSYMAT